MPARGRTVLVGGGVRSGKSAFALSRALALGTRRVFLATAEARDEEMQRRVERHQAERAGQFSTLEEPLAVPDALRAITGADVVLVDCLTLWLSNLIMSGLDDAGCLDRFRDLAAALRTSPFHTVLVTNEVGMGIVPETELGRRFRDLAGWTHQILTRSADEVYLAVLGMVLRLRPGPVEVESSLLDMK